MKKVLIVDDKPENLYLLQAMLETEGYKVLSAKNGAEALGLMRNITPDIIIADILMPIMDGFTLCRECKKDETLHNIPFFFYTATYTDEKDKEYALSLGADRFILKPQEPDVFLTIINDFLREVKNKAIEPKKVMQQPESVVLKEYNEVLVRKIEGKMLESEKTEKELREYAEKLELEIAERIRAEEELAESEEKYSLLYNNSVDAILLTIPNGGILSANPAACEIFGRSEEEICEVGRDGIVDLSDPRLKVALEERSREGKFSGELTLIRKDGTKFPAEITSAIYKNKKGEDRTSMIIRDITERKQMEQALRESEKGYKELINGMNETVWVIGFNGDLIDVNNSAVNVLGYSKEELLDIGLPGIDASMKKEDIQSLAKSMPADKLQIFETTHRKKDGREIPVEVYSSIVTYRGKHAIISIARDITERKKAEKELEKYRNHLEQLVEERTKELEEKNEELEYYNRLFEGREFRIKELRDKVKELEKRLQEKGE